MQYIFGRRNLALTVMVPYDCRNNCEFCTAKKKYQEKPGNPQKVEGAMTEALEVFADEIKDVVFTGGEPMENLQELKRLVGLVPNDKNVYINTVFLKDGAEKFAKFVNQEPKIKGVNISRHEERQILDFAKCETEIVMDGSCLSVKSARRAEADVASDAEIKRLIKKPVRINVVLQNQNVGRILERWEGRDVEVSLRRDFRNAMGFEALKYPYDEPVLEVIKQGYRPIGRSGCNVCETVRFEKYGTRVQYHKGMFRTSIDHAVTLEINDLIIDHTGKLMYDWEGSNDDVMQMIVEEQRRENTRVRKLELAFDEMSEYAKRAAEGLGKVYRYGGMRCGARRDRQSCGMECGGSRC